MTKLKYYTKNGKKIYTLKEEATEENQKTKDAHYKFLKIRDVKISEESTNNK